jgi:hypothetical protein
MELTEYTLQSRSHLGEMNPEVAEARSHRLSLETVFFALSGRSEQQFTSSLLSVAVINNNSRPGYWQEYRKVREGSIGKVFSGAFGEGARGTKKCYTCQTTGKQMFCPGCRVPFCSKDCQKKIWKGHKKLCKHFNIARRLYKYLSPSELAGFMEIGSSSLTVGLNGDPNVVAVCPGPSCGPLPYGVASCVVVTCVKRGEEIRNYGKFKSQSDYVFESNCKQDPCEARVPENWRSLGPNTRKKLRRYSHVIGLIKKAKKKERESLAQGEAR